MAKIPTELPTRARYPLCPNNHRRHHTHPNQHLHGCIMGKRLWPLDLQIATLLSLIRSPARGVPHKGSRLFPNSVISLLRPRIPATTPSLVLLLSPLLVLVDNGLNRDTGTMLPRISWPTLGLDVLLSLSHESGSLLLDNLFRIHERRTIRVLLGQ